MATTPERDTGDGTPRPNRNSRKGLAWAGLGLVGLLLAVGLVALRPGSGSTGGAKEQPAEPMLTIASIDSRWGLANRPQLVQRS